MNYEAASIYDMKRLRDFPPTTAPLPHREHAGTTLRAARHSCLDLLQQLRRAALALVGEDGGSPGDARLTTPDEIFT